MPIVDIPIHHGVYKNVDATTDMEKYARSMVNCYCDEGGNVNKSWGLNLFKDLSAGGFAGLYWWEAKNWLIAVDVTGNVYKVTSSSGAYTNITGTPLTVTGNPVVFDANNTYLLMANGDKVSYTNGTATTAFLADPSAYTKVSHVSYLGGFFALNNDGTQNFQPSDANAITFTNAQVNQKAQKPDNIIAHISIPGYLYVFGTESTEVWTISTGTSIFTLYYWMDRGLGAVYSIVRADNTIYFLDNTRRFVKLINNVPQVISTPYDKDIQSLNTVSDCIGSLTEVDGRPMIMWNFPTEGRTLVYDFMTNFWHERNAWSDSLASFTTYPYQYHAWCPAWGKHIFASNSDGRLFSASTDYFTESGTRMRTLHLTGNSDYSNNKGVSPGFKTCDWLEVWVKRGYGNLNTYDSDGNLETPQLMIRFRDDGQDPWSDYIYIDLGAQGDTELKLKVYNLGRFETRQWEFTTSDPVPYVITRARMMLTPSY